MEPAFYSKVLNKFFMSEDECLKAENEYEDNQNAIRKYEEKLKWYEDNVMKCTKNRDEKLEKCKIMRLTTEKEIEIIMRDANDQLKKAISDYTKFLWNN